MTALSQIRRFITYWTRSAARYARAEVRYRAAADEARRAGEELEGILIQQAEQCAEHAKKSRMNARAFERLLSARGSK